MGSPTDVSHTGFTSLPYGRHSTRIDLLLGVPTYINSSVTPSPLLSLTTTASRRIHEVSPSAVSHAHSRLLHSAAGPGVATVGAEPAAHRAGLHPRTGPQPEHH